MMDGRSQDNSIYRTSIASRGKNKLSVCFLFLVHGYSFELICTKFGVCNFYTVRMVMGLVSAACARGLALRAPSIRRSKSVANSVGKFGTSGRQP